MNRLFTRIFFSHLSAIVLSVILFIVINKFLSLFYSILVTSILASLIATVFSFNFSRAVSKRLQKIAAFAGNVARGYFDSPLSSRANDDMGVVESKLGEMARSLKTVMERLEDGKGQREAVLASMGEGVIVTDQRGTVTLVNKKANELLGKGLTGRSIVEISRDAYLHNLIEQGKGKVSVVNGEINLNEPKELTLSVAVSPLIRNMKVSGSVIVFHDITALKKLETMRKDFVANVSHELKTPLTAIKGFAETLIEGAINDEENALRFVGTIKKNADRLSRLVDDLLTLSDIELGKIELDIRNVNLHDAVNSVVSTLLPKAGEKNLDLNTDLQEGLNVMADRDRIEQILLNLVDNAIKFTQKGSITVSANKLEKGLVSVSVTDTGPGIPPKDLPRIGERFYRVDPARSRELGGTGLGLAIVKHLVSSMGGAFSVESEQNRGTRFDFTMPSA